jgi:hypothetical protein
LRLGAAILAGRLVALRAAPATIAGSGFSDDATDAIASRVIQGTITGIGFLGAGAIVRRAGLGRAHGLTPAAAIWVTAALGIVLPPRRLSAAGARYGLPVRDPDGRRHHRPCHRRPAEAGGRNARGMTSQPGHGRDRPRTRDTPMALRPKKKPPSRAASVREETP